MLKDDNILSIEKIQSFLTNRKLYNNIYIYDVLPSTNILAKELAQNKTEGVIIANEQTKGRGRMGKNFFSPPNSGIYLSIALKPQLNPENITLITTTAGVALCRAIKKVTLVDAKIKWVNDIILNEKKICGISCEGVTDSKDGKIDYVVVGIGVNFSTAQFSFPSELQKIAGPLLNNISKEVTRNRLIAEIINSFLEVMQDIENRKFISEYKNLSIVIGKEIEIIENNRISIGKALDIDENGGLIVEIEGILKTLTYGEISIRPFYNKNSPNKL